MGKKNNEVNDFANLSFEQALKMLEETVEKLENGGLTLTETTDIYEQGMKLSKTCSNMLKATEITISKIQTKYSDEISTLNE